MDKTPSVSENGGTLELSTQSPTEEKETKQEMPNNTSQQPNPEKPLHVQIPPVNNHDKLQRQDSVPFSPQSMSPDPVHDLPVELLQAGWRKFWSKRESRPYFFNKNTNESLWDMPMLENMMQQRDLLTDPLGIGGPGPEPGPAPSLNDVRISRASIDIPHHIGEKRRASGDAMCSPTKRPAFAYSPFWNFDIPTNVVIHERAPCCLPPPHPDVEVLRSQLTAKLRQNYQELCHAREGIDAPMESFNRWLLERKIIDKGTDPMLPSNCIPEISQSMYREVMNDIPVKLVKPKYSGDSRKQLFRYADAAKKMIESRTSTPESRKIVKWNVEETFTWLRRQSNASYEDYLERLGHLKRQCQPHLTETAKSSVEGICSKLYNMSCESVRKLHEKNWQILAEHNIHEMPPPQPPHHKRKVLCYPIQMIVPCPRLLTVEMSNENEIHTLKYRGEALKVNSSHFYKLEQLYRINCRDDPRFDNYLARVWCLLRRYHTFFGLQPSEGFGLHVALPVSVFDPILKFHPVSGSFEANPPFCEELMESMVDHFENLLAESNEPLSFIIFIPEWRDPPTEALIRLESSRFKRKQVVLPAYEHEYRHGFQHICPNR
ncbi:hypothetical protein KUTeg_019344, partial [Tegillarca granosa]